MRKIGFVALCILAVNLSFGQSYPADKEKFVKTLQGLTNDYLTKEQREFMNDKFQPALVKLNTFPDKYFNIMVANANAMEAKKLKAYPDIFNYVFSVYSFVENKQPEASFTAWQASIDKLLEAKNVKKFSDFIETSAGFFSRKALIEGSNESWFAYGNYVFEFTDKPLIRFTDIRLVCGFINKDPKKDEPRFLDSIVVYNTSGTFDPISKKWDGRSGKVDWVKVGLPNSETFAELKGYDINMKTELLSCDSVMLTSPYFPGKKILGKYSDRAVRPTNGSTKSFPNFISYDRKLVVKEIRPQMDYTGGFVMEGNRVSGQGTEKEPANLTIYRNSKPFIITNSQNYTFSKEQIISPVAKVYIKVSDQDTIFHPGVNFRYVSDTDVVYLTRGTNGISIAPFKDTYHELEQYVPVIQWDRKSNELILAYPPFSNNEQRQARFESTNFFDQAMYDRLQGVDQNHPLALIYNYCYKHDEFYVTEGTIATSLNKTVEQCRSLILELAALGFLTYDSESRMVLVNKKTENFVKSRAGRMDFDNLMFVSDLRPKSLEKSKEEIAADENLRYVDSIYKIQNKERSLKKNFGTISLTNLEMKLVAVDKVSLSDIQSTFVLPNKGDVLIKANRNFEFSGWVNSGKLQTMTKVASYDYAANKVFLTETGTSTYRVRPLKKEDGVQSILMNSSVEGITGELLVDAPNNRSGAKADLGFPKLVSAKPTKIFYNSPYIYKGAYDSLRFFYKVDPFDMDSLDNFSEKSMSLKGELTSAGIFPVIRQDVKIMNDYSFGFSTKAPEGGYVFYGTKAKYDNQILLSNNGLQGKGKIDYIQSTSESINLFTFLPDSTVGFAKFVNKPLEIGVQYPDVKSDEAYITYVPKGNLLKAASTSRADLEMFNGEAKMKGVTMIRPTGMTGMGIISMQKAQLGSDLFKFKRWDVDADTSIFNLTNPYKEEGESDLAMSTANFSAHVSYKDRKGEFKSNAGEQIMTFDINQYICKMDMFTWLMDQDELEMETKQKGKTSDISINSDLDLVVPNFYSIHPKQDSLQFRAPKAKFSQKEKTITCTKTEFIDVADARIFPDSMKVIIRKKADMDPLKNSVIVANYITKYHTFTKAETKITARRAYNATGIYPYYDSDSAKTLIAMDKITVDSSYQTIATGSIKPDANFKLSSQFDYYGTVNVKAANPRISFSGATRINHSCEKFAKSWMSFSAEIDPKNIQIPVTNTMKSLDGKNLSAGIVWHDSRAKDSIRLYPTFLSELEAPTDPIAMTATGLLQYDFTTKEYQISTKEKFANRAVAGNFLALNTETCSLNGDGVINLGMDYGPITVDAVGTISYDQTTGVTDLNTTMRFNIPMDKGVWQGLGDRIVAYEGSKPIDIDNTTLDLAIVNWQDQKTADKLKQDYTLSEDKKLKKVPDAFEKSIVITGVRLKTIPTSQDTKGLMSSVEGAGIVNLYGQGVMRQVIFRSLFEQLYSGNGDHFAFNMDVPGGSYYMCDYSMIKDEGKFAIYTSDAELAAAINAIKEDKRKEKNFMYEISTNSVLLAKLNRIFE